VLRKASVQKLFKEATIVEYTQLELKNTAISAQHSKITRLLGVCSRSCSYETTKKL